MLDHTITVFFCRRYAVEYLFGGGGRFYMTTHNRLLMVSLFMVLLICGPAAADDDTALLQGKWKVLTAKNNGGDIFKGKHDKMFVIIEKGEFRVVIEGTKSEQSAAFTLDPKQTPKQIEFTKETRDSEWEVFKGEVVTGFEQLPYKLFQSWKFEEKTLNVVPAKDKVLGIYELKDDTLKICWRTTMGKDMGKDNARKEPMIRPSKFESGLYYYQILFELQRVKSEK